MRGMGIEPEGNGAWEMEFGVAFLWWGMDGHSVLIFGSGGGIKGA